MSHALAKIDECHDMREHSFSARNHEKQERIGPWLKHREPSVKDFDVPFSAVLDRALEARPSVAVDFKVLGGTPHIVGTKIPVFMILDALEYHGTLEGVLRSFPQLTLTQVKDAVSFAAGVLEHPIDYEVEGPAR